MTGGSHLIVGSGNAARFVLKLLDVLFNSDFKAMLVSRSPDTCSVKFKEWKNVTISNHQFHTDTYDAIWLAVPDAFISSYAQSLKADARRWIHLSGATSLEALEPHADKGLVIWPIISLASAYDIRQVPFAIETATHDDFVEVLKLKFTNVIEMPYEKRLAAHMAAVVSNNFAHHLHALLEEELIQQGISRQFLKPIIEQTFQRILAGDLKGSQTGPARRGDLPTIEKHLKTIKSEKLLLLYKTLTQSIQKYYATELQANTTGNNDLRV
ncbi:hypothetical protein JCM31826_02880 [Thermaurantimonas aggregans]|uniref:DUF2520 domain-containing protein n=1 Tax=Thermaurantimonas aggregans TaxID=2173829 RepID=A0A401XIH2_9FLAO|nr:DUF2520 domain-containing protein [Thermaurantimonas aggregans]MCX8148749.1 DUF2520 domain-containing protein [Thermaurantimonas aggregans]GCD76806.1 hypothetical protein JCM31826_02880 [Thermaurantimonas aggregans]